MAWSKELRNETLRAAGLMDTRKYHAVNLNGSNVNECVLAAAGQGYGILQNQPRSGEAATVAVEGQTRARAGGAITAGAFVTAAATGYLVAVASGAASNHILGRARSGAASGSIFTMELGKFQTASGAPL
jgi:hypothetical protein